ncbi:formate dehydrogenase accessory protein [Pigmentiphaga humi]|uniref:Sulfur carrier protein FdhD n=1 Tax=Pigmentiphaga humi TaxID=2478468 RepID=A0A3P4B6A4_9BURK|nr:formate dehydrogenase accessory sulfurtransferase FdhD [Pigmentiphaga humi]VCU71834.1 formate dehydrogenase accessory protein [Pigmentiphaga humi]
MDSPSKAGHAPLAAVPVRRWQDGAEDARIDEVAEEVPVALEYNGISHAVMLASPCDLEDFALGFSLSEGILSRPGELYDCEIVQADEGIRVQLEIASERFVRLKDRRRNLTGRTGCGLCGTESLQQAVRHPPPVRGHAVFDAATLHRGLHAMQDLQQLQQRCGATHAAAWMQADGSVDLVREDVGRHNALDKLLGALASAGADFAGGAVLVTSRASYEMVQKTATLGIGMLAAVSAPTALAIRLAEETGVTLAGFVRPHSHVVYTHARRLPGAT